MWLNINNIFTISTSAYRLASTPLLQSQAKNSLPYGHFPNFEPQNLNLRDSKHHAFISVVNHSSVAPLNRFRFWTTELDSHTETKTLEASDAHM